MCGAQNPTCGDSSTLAQPRTSALSFPRYGSFTSGISWQAISQSERLLIRYIGTASPQCWVRVENADAALCESWVLAWINLVAFNNGWSRLDDTRSERGIGIKGPRERRPKCRVSHGPRWADCRRRKDSSYSRWKCHRSHRTQTRETLPRSVKNLKVSAYLSSKQLLPFGFALHCKRELVPRLGRRAICVLVPLWNFMTGMSPPTSYWLIIRPISPFYHPRLLNQTLFTHGSSFNHISWVIN